jgi:hypothetical protein
LRRQENEEAHIEDAGFPNQVLNERGNAPTSIGVSARRRSCFSYFHPSTLLTIGYASVGHGTQHQPILAKVLARPGGTYTGVTFSARGPFGLWPSVYDTF